MGDGRGSGPQEADVPDMPRPTLNELTRALAHLADRVLTRREPGLEPYMVHTLKLALGELEMLIPGLDPVPNAEAAKAFTEAAEVALQDGEEHEALSYALRGLSCSPHDPVLLVPRGLGLRRGRQHWRWPCACCGTRCGSTPATPTRSATSTP